MLWDLLRLVDGYLRGEMTARDLETALLERLQDVLNSGDERARALADKVDVALMELGQGFLSEAEFRRQLADVLREYVEGTPVRFNIPASDHFARSASEDETALASLDIVAVRDYLATARW